jgi:hypothetical protein
MLASKVLKGEGRERAWEALGSDKTCYILSAFFIQGLVLLRIFQWKVNLSLEAPRKNMAEGRKDLFLSL